MKAKYLILLSVIATMMLSSCGKATYIKSDTDVIEAPTKGSEGAVALISDGETFDVIYAPEWMTVEINDTTLNYKIEPNKTSSARKSYVVINSDTAQLMLPVAQCTRASYLIIPQTKVNINKEGIGTDLVVYTDGGDVKVDAPTGVKYEFYNGKLSFKSNGNTGQTKTSKVNVTCDDLSKEITIVQSGNICGTCHGKGRVVCYICNGSGVDYCPYRPCDICGGRGYNRCKTCKGTGK
jgi:hypothetical protein